MQVTTPIRDPRTLGAIVQQARMLKGLSQRDLANEIGVTQKWIWEMEQGKPGLFTTRLFRILDEVDVGLTATLNTEAAQNRGDESPS